MIKVNFLRLIVGYPFYITGYILFTIWCWILDKEYKYKGNILKESIIYFSDNKQNDYIYIKELLKETPELLEEVKQ